MTKPKNDKKTAKDSAAKLEEGATAKTTTPVLAFDVVEDLILPYFKLTDGKPLFVKIESECFTSDDTEKYKVINLETGETGEIYATAIMKTAFEEKYPDNGYIGKTFQIIRTKVEGSRFKNFKIQEIKIKA